MIAGTGHVDRSPDPARGVACRLCQTSGMTDRGTCSICGGAGFLPRLVIPVRILPRASLSMNHRMAFRRLAVLALTERGKSTVTIGGVTDTGVTLVTTTSLESYEAGTDVEFVERGRGWSP